MRTYISQMLNFVCHSCPVLNVWLLIHISPWWVSMLFIANPAYFPNTSHFLLLLKFPSLQLKLPPSALFNFNSLSTIGVACSCCSCFWYIMLQSEVYVSCCCYITLLCTLYQYSVLNLNFQISGSWNLLIDHFESERTALCLNIFQNHVLALWDT